MSSKNVIKLIKDKQVEFVDLRFTDPKGKLQHLTMDTTVAGGITYVTCSASFQFTTFEIASSS